MQRLTNTFLLIALLALMALAPIACEAATAGGFFPRAFTYQGQLNQSGNPHDGAVELTFTLWNSDDGGSQFGSELIETVEIDSGLFQVELEFGHQPWDEELWLQIEVDGQILSPRQPITAVPLASMALDVSDGRFWRQGGDSGTGTGDFLGTTDNAPFEIRVDGQRAMRIEPGNFEEAPNLIGGHAVNEATGNIIGATIAGGGWVNGGDVSDQRPNTVSAFYGTVGGGMDNTAGGSLATVGGGENNLAGGSLASISGGINNTAAGAQSAIGGGSNNGASGSWSTIGGGRSNTVSGDYTTVSGGRNNTAAGNYSFAAGRRANSNHDGAFVWADSTDADFASTGTNQFAVRATGGVGFGEAPSDYFVINTPFGSQDTDYSFGTGALRVRINGATRFRVLGNGGVAIGSSYQTSGVPERGMRVSGVVELATLGTGGTEDLCRNTSDGAISTCSSSRRYKQDIRELDIDQRLLEQLRPVRFRWIDSGNRDIGLIAEEVAEIDPRLVTVNADGQIEGVRYRQLSAVLIRALQEQREQTARVQSELADLTTRTERMDDLAERNARLEARLLRLERLLSETGQLALDY